MSLLWKAAERAASAAGTPQARTIPTDLSPVSLIMGLDPSPFAVLQLKCWLMPGEEDAKRAELEEAKKSAAPPKVAAAASDSLGGANGGLARRSGVASRYASAGGFGSVSEGNDGGSGGGGGVLGGLRPAGFGAAAGAGAGAAPALFKPPAGVFTPAARAGGKGEGGEAEPAVPSAVEEPANSGVTASAAASRAGSPRAPAGSAPSPAPATSLEESASASAVQAAAGREHAVGTAEGGSSAAAPPALQYDSQLQVEYRDDRGNYVQYSQAWHEESATAEQAAAQLAAAVGGPLPAGDTAPAAGGPLHAAAAGGSTSQLHDSFAEPHPPASTTGDEGSAGVAAALLSDPVFKEVGHRLGAWEPLRSTAAAPARLRCASTINAQVLLFLPPPRAGAHLLAVLPLGGLRQRGHGAVGGAGAGGWGVGVGGLPRQTGICRGRLRASAALQALRLPQHPLPSRPRNSPLPPAELPP